MSEYAQYDKDVVSRSLAHQWYSEQYVNTALLALLLYEYLITIRREVVTIWCGGFRAATWLFLLNRYLTIIYALLLTAADQSHGHAVSHFTKRHIVSDVHAFMGQTSPLQSCLINTRIFQTLSQILTIIFALFSALRIYAIWNRSRFLFSLVFMVNIVPVGANIYIHIRERVDYEVFPWACVCITRSLVSTKLHTDLVRGTRVAVIFGDAIVLFFTWCKTMSIRKEASSAHIKVKLTTLLIRDGTLFFFVLLALNLLQAILIKATEVPGYMMSSVNVITPILISRFMLDLREIGHDVPDAMDIPFITALAMREGVLEEYQHSASTLDVITPIRSRLRYNYEGAENFEAGGIDMEDMSEFKTEATDMGCSCEIVEVPRSFSISSRTTTY